MCMSDTTCGRCLVFFFVSLVVFFCWVFITADYVRLAEDGDPPLVLETDRLPMISADKKTIFVVSEEGLPIAHNFILRNPSIPIEKIVFRKPGRNSTVHTFPIQREALIATNHDFNKYDLPGLCAFIFVLLFVSIGMYMYLCRGLFWKQSGNRRSSNSNGALSSCESCCEGFTSIDILDDPFDTPLDSPLSSPVKPKKAKFDKYHDELETPLLIA